jgi:hypothetical protein
MRKIIIFLFFVTQYAFTQKDSIKAINNIYLEFNIGIGKYNNIDNYFNEYAPYIKNNLSIILCSKLYYKNKRFKTGISYGYLYSSGYINPLYLFDTGLNLFSKNAYPQYFGPSLAYGLFYNKYGTSLGHRFIKFGVDYYYNKFHVGLNYQWIAFKNAKFRTGEFKTTNIYLEIGYAFNLESFRKKK